MCCVNSKNSNSRGAWHLQNEKYIPKYLVIIERIIDRETSKTIIVKKRLAYCEPFYLIKNYYLLFFDKFKTLS